MIRKMAIAVAVVFATLVGAVAIAAQVSPSAYKDWGHKYGRSDGFFVDSSNRLYEVRNGVPEVAAMSKTWTVTFDDGAGEGLFQHSLGGLTTSTTLTNVMYFEDGLVLLNEPIVTQTLPVSMTASGLDIGGDQAADDGYEVFGGELGATGRPFVAGVDPAFKTCATWSSADVSGTDDLQFGFRNVDAARGGFDDYLDAATLGFNTAANPAAIKIATISGNAATVETDTTDTLADSTSTTWCVLVSAAGAVTYTIDGSAPSTTASMSLDTGTMLVPFFRFLQDTALMDDLTIASWETTWQ